MKQILLILSLIACTKNFGQQVSNKKYKEDFEYFWNRINDNYCYFQKKQIDWNSLKTFYASKIDTIQSRDAFVSVLETALYELFDHHVSLGTNTSESMRLVPTGADMWAEYENNKPVIKEVRKGFGAEQAGIRAGMEVLALNDIPVNKAIQPFLGHNTGKTEAKNYALRTALAGNHYSKRKITLLVNGSPKDFYPDSEGLKLEHSTYPSKVEDSIIGDIGYIKINNFLFDNSLIAEFDIAVDKLIHNRAIIIDMRETPSGGNTSVARAVLGRFITKEMFYQKHELWAEEKETGIKRSWVEIVNPRKNPFTGTVIIIADHWTGSVSEGITVGFDGMKRATIIGTQLAGLNGAVESFEMPNTKIRFTIPIEKLYHVNGTPREFYHPPIEIPTKNLQKNRDEILFSAIDFLNKKIK